MPRMEIANIWIYKDISTKRNQKKYFLRYVCRVQAKTLAVNKIAMKNVLKTLSLGVEFKL